MSFPHLSTARFDTEEYYHQRPEEDSEEEEEEEEEYDGRREEIHPAGCSAAPPPMFGSDPGSMFQASQTIIAGGDHRIVMNGNVTVNDRSTNHVFIGSQNVVGNVMQGSFNEQSYTDLSRKREHGRPPTAGTFRPSIPMTPTRSGVSVSGTSQFTTTSISKDGRTQSATITQSDIMAFNDPALGKSINQYVQATKMLAMSGALASNPSFTVMTGGDVEITKAGHHTLRLNSGNVRGNEIIDSFNKDSEEQY